MCNQIGEEKMDRSTPLKLPNDAIAFAGTIRGDTGGIDVFQIDLPERPRMYGEWKSEFAINGFDFKIQIASFGYGNRLNVGNPIAEARNRFSTNEKNEIERLAKNLFNDQEKRNNKSPFNMISANYLGDIIFLPGWLIQY